VLPTFGVPLDPWAFLVVLGVLLGLEVSRARGIRMGLEVKDVVDGITFTVLFGFFMAHVITVVGYHPERLAEEGIWSILKVWEGFSSTGGFIGGIMAIWIFYTWIRPHDPLRMADLIAFGFPIGWLFGRMGCAVVHDHIGQPTDFFMGMYFPPGHYAAGVRHELGFYEMLWCLPVIGLFWHLGKDDQPPGTFLGTFFVLYAPVRFGLDFLRNTDLEYADARYFGLTPAQYGVILMGLFGAWLLWRRDPDFKPWALDGEPGQAERALETAVA
jgi:phosphatidylglycerol:prolipoprotein diacylglycerol transferase